MYKKVHIDGGHCKTSRISYSMETEGYAPFDIVIQETTVFTFHGMFQSTNREAVQDTPEEVTFDNISTKVGIVAIEGYIKTKFASVPSRFENASYGCGSITNGIYKINVNVSNFTPNEDLGKGIPVTVIGNVDYSTGPLSITCKSSKAITKRDNIAAMSEVDLMRGGKTLKSRAFTID